VCVLVCVCVCVCMCVCQSSERKFAYFSHELLLSNDLLLSNELLLSQSSEGNFAYWGMYNMYVYIECVLL
jgi:hypothetical protein